MAMSKVEYHPNYDRYVEMITAHPNYNGLYYERKQDGRVKWVVASKSKNWLKRLAWWDDVCRRLGITIQKGCYAKAARAIHPTGKHVCQCCGKEKSIFYEYPTKPTLKRLNMAFGLELEQTDYTISEFVTKFCKTRGQLDKVAKILKLPTADNAETLIATIKTELTDKESNKLSPGVMSNLPDRFDGFHSYALCCREDKDKGRHRKNMKTYMQDRRAYEDWADGDYNLANRLMGEYHKQAPMPCPVCGKTADMTADHIGPLSLGFCHSKHFKPMCRKCNSAKSNRFTKADVDTLIALERQGEQVVSWHSKYIWDIVKNRISNDAEAKKASSIMAKCHQNILNIFAIIHKTCGKEFLMGYLHPEYSMVDYRFKNFDLNHPETTVVVATPLDNKNKRKNQERYVRIAFESLDEFLKKKNRKTHFLVKESSAALMPIYLAIRNNDFATADIELKKLVEEVSLHIYQIETCVRP